MSDPNFPTPDGPNPLDGTPFEGLFSSSSPMFSQPEQPQEPEQFTASDFAAGMAQIQEVVSPLIEMITGIKAKFVAAGWSQEAAEQLALGVWQMSLKGSGLL